jgi:nucleotide-binding universal stress UspA family protein
MSAAAARILVPVDGSENAARALSFALKMAEATPGSRVELINVQPPVPGTASRFMAKTELADYHREEAMKVLGPALAIAAKSGVPHDHHICVGEPGPVIGAFAKQLGCTQVVMGTRGLGGALGLLLGSVATETLEHIDLPVTLIK